MEGQDSKWSESSTAPLTPRANTDSPARWFGWVRNRKFATAPGDLSPFDRGSMEQSAGGWTSPADRGSGFVLRANLARSAGAPTRPVRLLKVPQNCPRGTKMFYLARKRALASFAKVARRSGAPFRRVRDLQGARGRPRAPCKTYTGLVGAHALRARFTRLAGAVLRRLRDLHGSRGRPRNAGRF